MKFEEFLEKVAPKIGPGSAFGLARDARMEAMEELIIKKGLVTEEEVTQGQENQLEKLAEDILKMPPISKG